MSHKFKSIENIYFDDGEAGKIGDAYIYNMSLIKIIQILHQHYP